MPIKELAHPLPEVVDVAPLPSRHFEIETVTDVLHFEEKAWQWNESSNFFSEYDPQAGEQIVSPMCLMGWWQASCASFSSGTSLAAVAVNEGYAPSAIAPLFGQGRWSLWCEPPGACHVYEPTEFLYRDQAALACLADHLASMQTSLVLPRVFADSPTVSVLERAYSQHGQVIRRPSGSCPYIAIAHDVDAAESLLSKRLLSDLRRARRKADKLGKVRFEMVAPRSKAAFDEQWQRFLKVESAGWKGKAGTAIARDAEMRDFYRRFGEAATQLGLLRFAWMYLDEVPVGVQLAIESSRRMWLLKIGYDERFAKCSPGQLLMFETLRYAVENKLVSYEFLGNAADWTRRWTNCEREIIELAVFARGIRGRLALLKWLARKVWRRLALFA